MPRIFVEDFEMASVTLPDGSKREYEGPVTVAQVAASIGAGLAKGSFSRTCGRQVGGSLARD